MKKIGLFLADIKEYLVLSVLIILSLLFLFSNDNSQIRFLRAFTITAFGSVQSGFSVIPNVFELQTENKYLRESNIRLSNEIATLKEMKNENARLTKLLNFKNKTNLPVVGAKIINKSLTQTRNSITLNVGEADSIKVNMPIITDDGLVGRITATSPHFSIAQILFNKDMRISVKNRRTRVDGILSYDGAEKVTVKNIMKSSDVTEGDVFITSEYSNYYPPGIPVAIVTETGNMDNLFKKVVAAPMVNFPQLEEVFVLKVLPDKERQELEKIYFNK
jgi:rod shape-determining protein MreC